MILVAESAKNREADTSDAHVLALTGVVIGIAGAFELTRVMQSLLFHVSATILRRSLQSCCCSCAWRLWPAMFPHVARPELIRLPYCEFEPRVEFLVTAKD